MTGPEPSSFMRPPNAGQADPGAIQPRLTPAMRNQWLLLIGALLIVMIAAVVFSQSPRPRPASTDETAFSAARAMGDVRAIARAPHPTGSAEHARVRAHLIGRLTALGLQVSTQSGPLPQRSIDSLIRKGGTVPDDTPGLALVNVIGVLPGKNPTLPAVALMAHYDSHPGSPGAADDSAGVAAILETLRALKARGQPDRDLIVIFTDAEEIGLNGSRLFWDAHPLAGRIGAVINLEARGGGGRALMFETGPGNGQMVPVFAQAAGRAPGGVASNSLAIFVYRLMPNDTDFSIPRDKGVQGLNFAFSGRPAQYHTAQATPRNLDQGALQHLGGQALAVADQLARSPALPVARPDVVYADVFGLVTLHHPVWVGWLLLVAAAGLFGLGIWRARKLAGLTPTDVGRGALDALWLLTGLIVISRGLRALSGPMLSRMQSADAYYDALARLPQMEVATVLAALAVCAVLWIWRASFRRFVVAGIVAVFALMALGLGGFDPVVAGAAVIAIALSLWSGSVAWGGWGGWLGFIAPVLVLAAMAQAVAPLAAFLLIWPVLVASALAASASYLDLNLSSPRALAPVAILGGLTAGWLACLFHVAWLGVGIDRPEVVALTAQLIMMLLRPLNVPRLHEGPARWTCAALIGAATLIALAARLSVG